MSMSLGGLRRRIAVYLSAALLAAVILIVVALRVHRDTEERLACPDCRVMLSPRVRLQPSSLATPLGNARFARNSQGFVFGGPTVSRGEIAVFAPDGTLSRIIGRAGSGPGEL